MTTKMFFLLIISQLFVVSISAQEFYIRPKLKYNLSLRDQNAPSYFYKIYPLPFSSPSYPFSQLVYQTSNFTLSNGTSPELDFGYRFSKIFGIELGLNYYSTNKTFDPDQEEVKNEFYAYKVSNSNWKYHSFTFRPAIVFTNEYHKSSIIAKASPLLGIGQLKGLMSDSRFKNLPEYRFDNTFIWGYSIGLEYNYRLFKNGSICIEGGFDYINYTPNGATLIKGRQDDIQRFVYVNQIVDEPYNSYWPATDRVKSIKQSIYFNSLYFAISFKYFIPKK